MTEVAQGRVVTKSAWLSKINWTQMIGMAVSAAVMFGCSACDMPIQTQAALVLGIQGVQSVATWVLKTWFTPTITPASASVSGQRTITLD